MAATKQERQLRRKAVLRILMDDKTGPMKDQKALVKILKSLGIPATQTSVSRDLRELGAVWVEGHYEIPVWNDDGENPLQKVLGFITGARAVADHYIFVSTQRGAGRIVAEALEAGLAKDILGTSADGWRPAGNVNTRIQLAAVRQAFRPKNFSESGGFRVGEIAAELDTATSLV